MNFSLLRAYLVPANRHRKLSFISIIVLLVMHSYWNYGSNSKKVTAEMGKWIPFQKEPSEQHSSSYITRNLKHYFGWEMFGNFIQVSLECNIHIKYEHNIKCLMGLSMFYKIIWKQVQPPKQLYNSNNKPRSWQSCINSNIHSQLVPGLVKQFQVNALLWPGRVFCTT